VSRAAMKTRPRIIDTTGIGTPSPGLTPTSVQSLSFVLVPADEGRVSASAREGSHDKEVSGT
jgi:hypothetical protein